MAEETVVPVELNDYDTLHFDASRILLVSEDDTEQESPTDSAKRIFDVMPDHWISEHQDILLDIHDDVIKMSQMTTLLDGLDFQTFCEYMEYVNVYAADMQDTCDWDNPNVLDHVCKMPRKRNPTFKQFVAHYLEELLELYGYLLRTNEYYDFGCFECFIELCHQYSSSSSRLT